MAYLCPLRGGGFGPYSLDDVADALVSDRRLQAKIEYRDETKVAISLSESLMISLHFDPVNGEIDLESKYMEVTFASAEQKLNQLIGPLLECVKNRLRPEGDSYELELRFDRSNPFYALYIAHLRPDQIDSFNITIAPRGLKEESLESVVITKDLVTIEALSISAFIELSKKFVLLRTPSGLLKGSTNV